MDANFIVKIADFGMSRQLNETDYYKLSNAEKPLPVRWLAEECLLYGRFTTKSDVVSSALKFFWLNNSLRFDN